MLLFVMIFIFLFRRIMRMKRAKGEQYTIVNEPAELTIMIPIIEIGCKIVYR
jgi:flagellar biogenesis protein FliO